MSSVSSQSESNTRSSSARRLHAAPQGELAGGDFWPCPVAGRAMMAALPVLRCAALCCATSTSRRARGCDAFRARG